MNKMAFFLHYFFIFQYFVTCSFLDIYIKVLKNIKLKLLYKYKIKYKIKIKICRHLTERKNLNVYERHKTIELM